MQDNWIPGAILTLGIFGLAQIGSLVWFIAETKTLLKIILDNVTKLEGILKDHDRNRYTNLDATKDFAFRDQQIKAMWETIDQIKEKVYMR